MTKMKTLELSRQNIGVKRLTFHHDFEIPLVCWNLKDFLYFLFGVVVEVRKDSQFVRTYKKCKTL